MPRAARPRRVRSAARRRHRLSQTRHRQRSANGLGSYPRAFDHKRITARRRKRTRRPSPHSRPYCESGADTTESFTPYNEDVKIKLLASTRASPDVPRPLPLLAAPDSGVHKHYGYSDRVHAAGGISDTCDTSGCRARGTSSTRPRDPRTLLAPRKHQALDHRPQKHLDSCWTTRGTASRSRIGSQCTTLPGRRRGSDPPDLKSFRHGSRVP